MAGHSRLSLGAYGGYAVVLDIPGNRYTNTGNKYLSTFMSSSKDSYSSKSIGYIQQNMRANNAVIAEQKALWEKIESTLPAGESLIDLLRKKQVGNAFTDENGNETVSVYNNPAALRDLKKDVQEMRALQKELTSRSSQYESTFRGVLTQLSAAAKNFGRGDNLDAVIAQVKAIGATIEGKLDQAFVQKIAAALASDMAGQQCADYLREIYESLQGSPDDTITFDGKGGMIVNGTAAVLGNQKNQGLLNEIMLAMTEFQESSAYLQQNADAATSRRKRAAGKPPKLTDILKTSLAVAKKMTDPLPNGQPNYKKRLIISYHKLLDLLQEANNVAKKRDKNSKNKITRAAISKQITKIVSTMKIGQQIVIKLPTENFYGKTGEIYELLTLISEQHIDERILSQEDLQKLIDGGTIIDTISIDYEHTGNKKDRLIIEDAGAIKNGNLIQDEINNIGTIIKNLIADDSGSLQKANLAAVSGKIDSLITLSGKSGEKYKIAFSDKLYNAGALRDFKISGGNLLTNLISLTSGTSIDNHALFVLLLNLSSAAAFYAENPGAREDTESLLQTMMMQNFFALSFDPSNANYSSEDTLYVSNYSGSIVPLYSALTEINNFTSLLLNSKSTKMLKNAPVKVEIDYADGYNGWDLWQASLGAVPPIISDDGADLNKRERWDYVASTIASATDTRISFDMIAFNNLYHGFF